jgi:hypothetical protein
MQQSRSSKSGSPRLLSTSQATRPPANRKSSQQITQARASHLHRRINELMHNTIRIGNQ